MTVLSYLRVRATRIARANNPLIELRRRTELCQAKPEV